MCPFEGNHYADVAPGENEFDTPGLMDASHLDILFWKHTARVSVISYVRAPINGITWR